MAKVVTKLYKRPEDAQRAVEELKAKGYEVGIVEQAGEVEKALADAGLSEQALEYYKLGTSLGGKVIKVSVDESKISEVNQILLAIGRLSVAERAPSWQATPGFARAPRMSATNPIDAQMTGDFRRY